MSKILNPDTEGSVTCGFFNSINDRKYDAQQMGAIFDGVINDGIFATIGDAFEVKATTGKVVTVGTGKCWFNHTWTVNDALLPITLPDSDQLLNRIDAIVIEVNNDISVRDNSIKVLTGEPSKSVKPLKPSLTKENGVYQYALCYISRAANSTEIKQDDIEEARGFETPFVTALMETIDPTTLVEQWTAKLNTYLANGEAEIDEFKDAKESELEQFKTDKTTDLNEWYIVTKQHMADITSELNIWTAGEKATIMAWFDNVKGQLSEDPAMNLQIQIDANEVERLLLEGLPDGTKTISEDGTVIKTVDSKGRALVKTFTDEFSTITSVLTDRENTEYLSYPYSTFGGAKTKTVSGVTFTDNGDRTVTVNGTATADAILVLASGLALSKDTYILSGCPVGGSEETYYFGVNVFNNTTYVTATNEYGSGATLDTTELTYTTCNILICIKSGKTVNNITFNPKVMIVGSELGKLVKKISADGKTISSTLTNNADAVPNLVEIERAVDTILASENTYIEGDA